MLSRIAQGLHRVTGMLCQGLMVLIVLGQLAVVILRYVFGIGFIELQDAVAYSFAALVVLGLPVALVEDGHVRVDVLRAGQSREWQRRFDQAGVLLFLLPVFGLVFWWVWPDVAFSWSIFEGSKETGGLPGLFLVKTMLPVACVLMIIQGLASVVMRHG